MDAPAPPPTAAALRATLAAFAAWSVGTRARRCALAIQGGLDTLAANGEAALVRLEDNSVVALAALQEGATPNAGDVHAAIASGVDAVHMAAASKRAGLETELVAVDVALVQASEAVGVLAEVRYGQPRPDSLILMMHGLFLLSSSRTRSQAVVVLDDDALVQHAAELFSQFEAGLAGVAAIPEEPATSSFLAVEPVAPLDVVHMDAAGLRALAVVWVAAVSQ